MRFTNAAPCAKMVAAKQGGLVIFTTYFACGMMYASLTIKKIFESREHLTKSLEEEFGEHYSINGLILFTLLLSIICWPVVMLNEIKSQGNL